MTTRERELIVGALRIRRDLVALMMRNEAPCYKTRDELQALWQELKTLADRIETLHGGDFPPTPKPPKAKPVTLDMSPGNYMLHVYANGDSVIEKV